VRENADYVGDKFAEEARKIHFGETDPRGIYGEATLEEAKGLAEDGVSFLLAEQNTNMALRYAHYGYILENGRVVLDGDAAALRENEDVKEFYLGVGGEGRRSFRDVKHYRRRKRWL